MNPGELNRKVTLQSPLDGAPDASTGFVDREWEDLAEVWAKIEPLSGREYFQAAQVQSDVTHRITIWYRDGVTPRMRLKYSDRTRTRYLNLVSVIDPGEAHEVLVLMCVEQVEEATV